MTEVDCQACEDVGKVVAFGWEKKVADDPRPQISACTQQPWEGAPYIYSAEGFSFMTPQDVAAGVGCQLIEKRLLQNGHAVNSKFVELVD